MWSTQRTFMSFAFSRMYFPSLYFWLSSKARSYMIMSR